MAISNSKASLFGSRKPAPNTELQKAKTIVGMVDDFHKHNQHVFDGTNRGFSPGRG